MVFTFVFGFMRVEDSSMEPRFQNGDLVLFYPLDKDYGSRDVAVLAHKGVMMAGRVVALEGDAVNIDSQGMIVNGAYQQGQGITDEACASIPEGCRRGRSEIPWPFWNRVVGKPGCRMACP